jgi:hypothetical protein
VEGSRRRFEQGHPWVKTKRPKGRSECQSPIGKKENQECEIWGPVSCVLSVGEGLTLLSLLKLLKLLHIRLSPSAMCRPQLPFRLSFQFFISHAALNLVATQIKISIYLAESADNLPDHRLKL